MAKTSTLVMVGGLGVLAYMMLKNQGQNAQTPLNLMIGGEHPSSGFDLSSIFSGIGDMFSGLKTIPEKLSEATGTTFDFKAYLDALFGGLSGGTTPSLTVPNPLIPKPAQGGTPSTVAPNLPNTIPNIFNSAGNMATAVTKLLVGGGATYLAVKTLSPIAKPVGNLFGKLIGRIGGTSFESWIPAVNPAQLTETKQAIQSINWSNPFTPQKGSVIGTVMSGGNIGNALLASPQTPVSPQMQTALNRIPSVIAGIGYQPKGSVVVPPKTTVNAYTDLKKIPSGGIPMYGGAR